MDVKGAKIGALVLALVLLGSLVPLGLAAGNGTNTTSGSSLENATREQLIATNLIDALERLSKFAEKRIEPIKDKLPENSSVVKSYELAEEYRGRALEEYNSGDYYEAILDGLTAMHYYKRALAGLKEGKERLEMKARVRAQVERMNEYLRFVKKTITIAERQGVDVGNLTRAYNETLEAYRTVLQDLRKGNVTKAREDLEVLRERKTVLDGELKKVREELAHKNADKIVKDFLRKSEKSIEVAQRAIREGQERGYNVTELQNRLEEFIAVYNQVKALAHQGNYDEALNVIQENRETIGKFHRAMAFLMRKARERELKGKLKNLGAFIHEMEKTIRKDEKALKGLRRRGVDTRKAELQLRVAVQELKLGLALVRNKRPAEAKAHFAMALDLLHRVNEFILAHS